jgi:hypothetical protein
MNMLEEKRMDCIKNINELDRIMGVNENRLTLLQICQMKSNSSVMNHYDHSEEWYFEYFEFLDKYFKCSPNFDYGFTKKEIETFKRDYEIIGNMLRQDTVFPKEKINLLEMKQEFLKNYIDTNQNNEKSFQTKDVNQMDAEKIISMFVKQQNKYGNEVDENQLHNIKLLVKELCNTEKRGIPIIANLPMGHGKSKAIIEYLKFMHEKDNDFGAIIVKKTIEECRELNLDLGLSNRDYQKYCIDANIMYPEGNPHARKILQDEYDKREELFISRVIRGFNFHDCSVFNNAVGNNNEQLTYDYRLCSYCEKKLSCKTFLSRVKAQNHRIIAITHQRLFQSNDSPELMKDLLRFNDKDGNKKLRQLIIIDEKIESTDVKGITMKEFYKLKNEVLKIHEKQYNNLFEDIEVFLKGLKFPKTSSENIIPQNKLFKENFRFDDDLVKKFYKKNIDFKTLNAFIALEKILGTEKLSTHIDYPQNELAINCYRYVDISEYCLKFDKSIILDGTSKIDLDYCNSKACFIDGIKDPYYFLNIHHMNVNMSKYSFKDCYDLKLNSLVNEIDGIAKEFRAKTLIVCYQDISTVGRLKDDLLLKLCDRIDKNQFEVIHHGQYTTGINKFNDYHNIIIIGNLNKRDQYYQNKSLALGMNVKQFKNVVINDYVINSIQQICRSAIRQKESVNVFMFNNDKLAVKEVAKFFNVNVLDYSSKFITIKRISYIQIKDMILSRCINVDDKITKKEIKDILDLPDSTYTSSIQCNADEFKIWLIINGINEGNNYFIKTN